ADGRAEVEQRAAPNSAVHRKGGLAGAAQRAADGSTAEGDVGIVDGSRAADERAVTVDEDRSACDRSAAQDVRSESDARAGNLDASVGDVVLAAGLVEGAGSGEGDILQPQHVEGSAGEVVDAFA